ncbi:hypothetical protein [Streptomyces sp. NPDC020607]|uniref:hypothetical protein n=1 Tax=Streptomyces sp. NPDC020607 TaxID=3365082 RepID=UPI00378DB695
MKRRYTALASLATVLALVAAVPASAAPRTHFYAFENPTRPTKSRTVDVVENNASPSEHQTGTCKNIRIGRDFYNESGRTVQLFKVANCAGYPDYQLGDGEELINGPGLQSVFIVR